MEEEGVTRMQIMDCLLEDFPNFYANEDTQTKRKFLSQFYECKCTDCGGNDAVNDCKLETIYFKSMNVESKNTYYECFGGSTNNDIEHVVDHTHL